MKRFLIALLLLGLATPAWSQSRKKKSEDTEKTEAATTEQSAQEGEGDGKKNAKEKKKPNTRTIQMKQPAKYTAGKKPTGRKKSNEPEPEPITVLTYYYELPIDFLPIVKEEFQKMRKDKYAKQQDDKDFRNKFVKNKNTDRGYVELTRPGDSRYHRLQLYTAADGQLYMAVQQMHCTPKCENDLKIFKKVATSWEDVTAEMLPALDKKAIAKTVKAKYKSEYNSLDLYTERGYDEEAKLDEAVVFEISADEDKIVVKDQYLNLEMYYYVFDAKKSKFELKKI